MKKWGLKLSQKVNEEGGKAEVWMDDCQEEFRVCLNYWSKSWELWLVLSSFRISLNNILLVGNKFLTRTVRVTYAWSLYGVNGTKIYEPCGSCVNICFDISCLISCLGRTSLVVLKRKTKLELIWLYFISYLREKGNMWQRNILWSFMDGWFVTLKIGKGFVWCCRH